MPEKITTPVWVTLAVTSNSRRSLVGVGLDKHDAKRSVILPQSLVQARKVENGDKKFQVPQWWAYQNKLQWE